MDYLAAKVLEGRGHENVLESDHRLRVRIALWLWAGATFFLICTVVHLARENARLRDQAPISSTTRSTED